MSVVIDDPHRPSDLMERLAHIDQLLDQVEDEVSVRNNEAKHLGNIFLQMLKTKVLFYIFLGTLGEASREGKRRYLLSRRQNFTVLDESITKILLEIDSLERSHHGAYSFFIYPRIEPSPTSPIFSSIYLFTAS